MKNVGAMEWSMFRFLVLVLSISYMSFCAWAEEDPCDYHGYPIEWERNLLHPVSVSSPSIYLDVEQSRLTISVSTALKLIEENMGSEKSFFESARNHIIQSLESVRQPLTNADEFFIAMDDLTGQELQTAIHIMFGFQKVFEHALMTERASVQIRDDMISTSTASFRTGMYDGPDEFNKVKMLLVRSSTDLVYKICWLDK